MSAFNPYLGQSKVLSATTGNKSVSVPQSAYMLRFYNAGPDIVCVTWSTTVRVDDTAPVVSVTTDMAIAVGAIEVFTKADAVTLGYKCPTSTATLYVTPGTGE